VKTINIVTPLYNDWDSLAVLIHHISLVVKSNDGLKVNYVVVNDCSTQDMTNDFKSILDANLTTVGGNSLKIINLNTNVGHQRAIAIGLQYVFNEEKDFDYVLVMDSDGEDMPQHIIDLTKKAEQTENKKVIFAQRHKRQESRTFQIGYFFYKYLFYFLTGQKISFGNFSLIPKALLRRVVYQPNLWNHYSGGILQAKIPFDTVLLDRGKRYKGVSKMNFNSLVIHGLSAISVYFDQLSVRVLKYTIYFMIFCLAVIGVVLFQKYVLYTAIPGWTSSLILITLGIIMQLFTVTLMVLLMQLSSRKNVSVPKTAIYKKFISNIE
jgi:glycosyltransferase involved in cell wall biosynthesis